LDQRVQTHQTNRRKQRRSEKRDREREKNRGMCKREKKVNLSHLLIRSAASSILHGTGLYGCEEDMWGWRRLCVCWGERQ